MKLKNIVIPAILIGTIFIISKKNSTSNTTNLTAPNTDTFTPNKTITEIQPADTPTTPINVNPFLKDVKVAYVNPSDNVAYGTAQDIDGNYFSGVLTTTAQTQNKILTPQEQSNYVQQSFGVNQTSTINNVIVPVTHNTAQNTNNALRAALGLSPV